MYYRNAQAAVVVYDVTKAASLEKAKSWVKELQRQANPNIVIALAGNKVDLVTPSTSTTSPTPDAEDEPDDATATPGESPDATDESESLRQVPKEEAQAYATEAGLLFFETSAKTGEGVVPLFTEIGKDGPDYYVYVVTEPRDKSEEDPDRTYPGFHSKQRTKWGNHWTRREHTTKREFGGERTERKRCLQLLIPLFYRRMCSGAFPFSDIRKYETVLYLRVCEFTCIIFSLLSDVYMVIQCSDNIYDLKQNCRLGTNVRDEVNVRWWSYSIINIRVCVWILEGDRV